MHAAGGAVRPHSDARTWLPVQVAAAPQETLPLDLAVFDFLLRSRSCSLLRAPPQLFDLAQPPRTSLVVPLFASFPLPPFFTSPPHTSHGTQHHPLVRRLHALREHGPPRRRLGLCAHLGHGWVPQGQRQRRQHDLGQLGLVHRQRVLVGDARLLEGLPSHRDRQPGRRRPHHAGPLQDAHPRAYRRRPHLHRPPLRPEHPPRHGHPRLDRVPHRAPRNPRLPRPRPRLLHHGAQPHQRQRPQLEPRPVEHDLARRCRRRRAAHRCPHRLLHALAPLAQGPRPGVLDRPGHALDPPAGAGRHRLLRVVGRADRRRLDRPARPGQHVQHLAVRRPGRRLQRDVGRRAHEHDHLGRQRSLVEARLSACASGPLPLLPSSSRCDPRATRPPPPPRLICPRPNLSSLRPLSFL